MCKADLDFLKDLCNDLKESEGWTPRVAKLMWVIRKESQKHADIKRKQREGIDAAKARGQHLGRPSAKFPALWIDYYLPWKNGEITAKYAMEKLGIKRTTFYKLVKRYENGELGIYSNLCKQWGNKYD